MTYCLIDPRTATIPAVDNYLCADHMPSVNFNVVPTFTLEQSRKHWLLKNTITDLVNQSGSTVDQHFFIFEHYCYLDGYENNSCFLSDFFLNTAFHYQKSVTSQIDFAKKNKSVNCPMNKLRPNRLLASCYFANYHTLDNLNYTQSWENGSADSLLFELLQMGGLTSWENNGVVVQTLDKFFITNSHTSNNLNLQLVPSIPIIQPSAISVVLEPIFWEPGCILTEKYLNAVYGGTIPVVDGYCVYDCLEAMGFDVFKDIVDTSSQYEKNSILRVWNMLKNNQTLFDAGLEIINRRDIQERILDNFNLAKNPELCLMNFIKNRNRPDLVEKCWSILKSLPASAKFCQFSLKVYLNYNK
jgi:hypothetical protein